ncbi:MAG: hypothetical protein Kow0020_08390 [Wenzhouxiangellaceae bacterium]
MIGGAWIDHGLWDSLDAHTQHAVGSALRYHLMAAVMVTMIGWYGTQCSQTALRTWLLGSAWLFTAGTLLFSFGIYAWAATGIEWLKRGAPFGGLMLIAGWLALMGAARHLGSGSGRRSGSARPHVRH